jgi:hypothetical protein
VQADFGYRPRFPADLVELTLMRKNSEVLADGPKVMIDAVSSRPSS